MRKLPGAVVIGTLALFAVDCGGEGGTADANGASGGGQESQTQNDVCAALANVSTDVKEAPESRSGHGDLGRDRD